MTPTYKTPFGMPTRYPFESGLHIENEFLFSLYQAMFTGYMPAYTDIYYAMAETTDFPNHISDTVPETEISHDQLTAYSCYSFKEGYHGHTLIYNKIKGMKFKDRILHPRDIIFYALLNKKLLGFLLLPLLYLICAASLFIGYRIKDGKIRTKLSGELLWILRYTCVKNDKLLNACMYPCRAIVGMGADLRFGSIRSMVSHYFHDDQNNPLVRNLNV